MSIRPEYRPKHQPEQQALKSIVLIGNHLPRQCGIATFTTHLLEAIALNVPDTNCWAIAMNDKPEGYAYPPQVQFEINQNRLSEYSVAADKLNHKQVDVVCLQHEYGIFGGQRGGYIIELLRNLKMPVVTTLHTILKDPTAQDRHIMKQLSELSDRLVVMSERSIEFLKDIYSVPEEKIVLIQHGIPDMPMVESDTYKHKLGVSGKKVILTFGLISPGKGIETVIDALPEIVNTHPEVVYMIVGATHPHLKAEHGEDYRIGLQLRAKKLGIADHVMFHDHFVAEEDLVEFIGAADIYLTPYLNEAQIVSGSLAYALGKGKAVVSTPYWYAEELLAEGRGRLFPFRDHLGCANEIIDLLSHPDKLRAIQEKAYDYGRTMVWSYVSRQYLDVFEQTKRQCIRQTMHVHESEMHRLRQQPLPEIKLDHLRRMTDGAGMLQHSKYTVPDRTHGYCVDDNARALVVAVTAHKLHPQDSSLLDLSSVYLSFLDHAFNIETGRFRNFMSYERNWLEQTGSEDSHGRALWGLGIAAVHSRNKGQVACATELFQRALDTPEHFTSPRAIAFTIIGLHAYLTRYSEDRQIQDKYKRFAEQLINGFRLAATKDWPWCEQTLTYDNARLPQALLLAGQRLGNDEMIETGLRVLTWLKQSQTDEMHRYFNAVGNQGWFTQGQKMAQFDQQPVEAAAMIDACIEAFQCSHDQEWVAYAYHCLNWYLGDNALQLPLYDHATGGCRDGLQSMRVNENQGAESSLSWLMSLLAVYNHRSLNRSGQDKQKENQLPQLDAEAL